MLIRNTAIRHSQVAVVSMLVVGLATQSSGQYVPTPIVEASTFGTVTHLSSLDFQHEPTKARLKSAIGNNRVVLLGEQTHGDGTTFTAKINLIKLLHEEMGFDVIAFESDLFALNMVNREFQLGGDLLQLVDKNVYGIWTNAREMNSFYQFMMEVRGFRPISIAGFDCRHSLNNSMMYMVRDVTEYLKALSFDVNAPEFIRFCSILSNLNTNEYMTAATPEEESFFFEELKRIQRFVDENLKSERSKYYQNLLRSIGGFAKNSWSVRFVDGNPGFLDKYENKYGSLRDFYLAQNALYLINEQYKGRKIILWGATYHFAKNLRKTDSLETKHNYHNTLTMGDVLSASGLAFYTMGFTAYKGSFGMPWTSPPVLIKPASEGSFENWAHGKGMRYGFLDLDTDTKFLMQPLGHNEMKATWSEILNGMIFIDEMRPVTPK